VTPAKIVQQFRFAGVTRNAAANFY